MPLPSDPTVRDYVVQAFNDEFATTIDPALYSIVDRFLIRLYQYGFEVTEHHPARRESPDDFGTCLARRRRPD